MEVHHRRSEPWRVTILDTGEATMTGGRLKRVREYLGDATFCFTYGDGVGDVNITGLVAFHKAEGRQATLTGVQPPGRYGSLGIRGSSIESFQEKPAGDGGWINGGFFVLDKKVLGLIVDDNTSWERDPLETLAKSGELMAFKHEGFWQPIDTLRDKRHLDQLWAERRGPWLDGQDSSKA